MKIFIICSKRFYGEIPKIKKYLEDKGHLIELPNCFNDSEAEIRIKKLSQKEHAEWKAGRLRHSTEVIKSCDAVLVLNFDKDGVKNYIGGATFLEMYDAFRLNKKIFLFNEIPEGILRDEIVSFAPLIINGVLNLIE